MNLGTQTKMSTWEDEIQELLVVTAVASVMGCKQKTKQFICCLLRAALIT